MYLENKYNETPPVMTFAAVGAACFPRDLDGPGRTDLLEDVDPFKFYTDVTDFEHYLDPWGGALGPDIGTTCKFGKPKNSVDEMKKTPAYKYCKKIQGYHGSKLITAI